MEFKRGMLDVNTLDLEEQISITARPALGGYSFQVLLKGRPTRWSIGAKLLQGSLQFSGKNQGQQWPVFTYNPAYAPPTVLSEGQPQNLYFDGLLSHAQLEAFEKARDGKDFDVVMRAYLFVVNASGAFENWSVQDSHLHKVAQEWLTTLANSGFKKYLFMELAFPAGESAKPDSAWRYLMKAREHFDIGLYRECVTSLRMALEQLRKRRDDGGPIDLAKGLYKGGNREGMTLGQRLLFMREAVHNVLHLGAHPEEDEKAFNRENAKALLIMVSSLAELFPEP